MAGRTSYLSPFGTTEGWERSSRGGAIRGYTGHEHYREFNLINMNGRMYDPVVGRMLSPDPFVQASDFTQSYNRYSYCWNNPLKYADPSGMKIVPSLYDPDQGGRADPSDNDGTMNRRNSSLGWDRDLHDDATLTYDWESGEYYVNGGTAVSSEYAMSVANSEGSAMTANDWNEMVVGADPAQLGSVYASTGGGPDLDVKKKFDVDKAIKLLNQKAPAGGKWGIGKCAKNVREAINAGGISTPNNPVSAGDYDTYLIELGFTKIDQGNYMPQKGDIAVFEAVTGHPYGHIQMYTGGSQWTSDFFQPSFTPGSDYKNGVYTILRW